MANKKPIRICFDGGMTWGYLRIFNKLPGISESFEFIEDRRNPQLVIYCDKNHIKDPIRSKHNCPHMLYCYEYMIPDMRVWDYALNWDYTSGARCMRYPNYIIYGAGEDLIKPKNYDPERILRSKKKFCAFVQYSHRPYRNQFFDILNRYKHVDAPGKQCNNMRPLGGNSDPKDSRYGKRQPWVHEVRDFFKDYKFVITFENGIHSGYVTEKIYNAMLCNAIPIYLGAPDVYRDFNVKSFVHVRDFCSRKNAAISPHGSYPKMFMDAVKYILELDKNDKAYCDMLAQPWYNHNVVNEYADKNNMAKFFKNVFERL